MTYLNDRELFFKGDTASTIKLTKPSNKIGFKRLSSEAIVPTKAHASDSGFDLYASEDVIIEPGETKIIPTGIAVELPEGFEAQVRPRSGVTAKTKLRVQLGTIDNGYTGEIGVIVDNIAVNTTQRRAVGVDSIYKLRHIDGSKSSLGAFNNNAIYKIRKGDRIAQLVVQELPKVVAVEIEEFTEDSERGEGGFGSSGV